MTTSNDEEREYPEHPLVGVGAVVVQDGKILLVQRGKEPRKGVWSIPGGLVELGEDVKDALRREVLEETGLRVEPVELFEIVDAIENDEKGRIRFHYVIVDFLADCAADEPVPGSDVLDSQWFSLDDLPEMTSSAKTVIDKAARRMGR